MRRAGVGHKPHACPRRSGEPSRIMTRVVNHAPMTSVQKSTIRSPSLAQKDHQLLSISNSWCPAGDAEITSRIP